MPEIEPVDRPGKLRRTMLMVILSVVVASVALLILISPLVKYLIEKHDYAYTGRQIHVDRVYFNPFTGFLQLNEVRIEEKNNKSIFLSAGLISIKINLRKLINRNIDINELHIDKMRTDLIQTGDTFNISDLLLKFKTKPQKASAGKKFSINIKNVLITENELHYIDMITPVHYFIKNIRIESNSFFSNNEKINLRYSFKSGSSTGNMSGKFDLNINTLLYGLSCKAEKYDLGFVEPYLKDISNNGTFTANIDADIKTKGNFNSREDISLSGKIDINKFHFGPDKGQDYASFDCLSIGIKALDPKNKIYSIDSISLDKPYFLYELYDSDNNYEKMFGREGSKVVAAVGMNARFNLVIEIARYVKVLSANFFRGNYLINHVAIRRGDLRFSDFSVGERFSMDLSPLFIQADSVSKNFKRVNLDLSSGIVPYGQAKARLSINPNDSSDFDISYHMSNVPISAFNPYFINYSSYSINRGTLEMKGNWNVRNGDIKSTNHFLLIDPRNSDRIKNKGNRWAPLPLIFAMVRENGNVIDYEIPVNGNLKDPKFKLKDIISDLISNILTKPFTTPYRYDVRRKEIMIEESLAIMWETNKSELNPISRKFVEKIAKHLSENPTSIIRLQDQVFSLKEKEYILFHEAKKKFYMSLKGLPASALGEKDLKIIQKMSIRNPAFIMYLNKNTSDSKLYTIQAKCLSLIGTDMVNLKYSELKYKRRRLIQGIFSEREVLNQVLTENEKTLIPYNGFSFVKIDYRGQLPDYLLRAYIEMYRLNNLAPRKRFTKTRSGIGRYSNNTSNKPK